MIVPRSLHTGENEQDLGFGNGDHSTIVDVDQCGMQLSWFSKHSLLIFLLFPDVQMYDNPKAAVHLLMMSSPMLLLREILTDIHIFNITDSNYALLFDSFDEK